MFVLITLSLLFLRIVSTTETDHTVTIDFLRNTIDDPVTYPYYMTNTRANTTTKKYESGLPIRNYEIVMHEETGLYQISRDGTWGLYDIHLNRIAIVSEEFASILDTSLADQGIIIDQERLIENLKIQAPQELFSLEKPSAEEYRSIFLQYLDDLETSLQEDGF